MEQDKPAAPSASPTDHQDKPLIADFLYRDQERFASFYAQLFAGRTITIERNDADRHGQEVTGQIMPSGIGVGQKHINEVTSASKRLVDPHDIAILDVISKCQETDLIRYDIGTAPHGSLIWGTGRLCFVDNSISSLAVEIVTTLQSTPRTPQEKHQAKIQSLLKKWLDKHNPPAAFLLETDESFRVGGTIKESFMQEPISTYYFRHGGFGLASVHVIGIKETTDTFIDTEGDSLILVGRNFASGLYTLLLPPDTIRVTPLVIFRVITL